MGEAHFHSPFLILLLFFFSIFEYISVTDLCYVFVCFLRFLLLIILPLKNQKEAEAGAAEEHPARNISGYLSIRRYHLRCFVFSGIQQFFCFFHPV
jgi:Ca2+/Na+ antiporter